MIFNAKGAVKPQSCTENFQRFSVFLGVLCGLFLFSFSPAQQKSEVFIYARKIVDTLASPSMHGRGYVLKGDSIAADYIKNEFIRLGLIPIGEKFYQLFSFPVNTFPNEFGLGFRGNDNYFENGTLVLINPNSSSIKNNRCKVLWFDSLATSTKKNLKQFSKNDFSDKIIVIDSKGIKELNKLKLIEQAKRNPYKAKAIVVFNNKKLTWDVSQTIVSFPSYELLVPDSLNKVRHKQFEYLHFNVESKFIPNYQSQNVLGYIKGTQYPDSFIVFTAHYDHLGMMGKSTYFPGANDNASGVAMLLNLAKHYSQQSLLPSGAEGGGLKYSVAFMAFGAEEVGLLGSKYYVEHPLFPLNKIKFLVNFDIVGTGDEGIKVVNATEHKEEFDALVKINSEQNLLPSVQPRGKAAISDHHFFEEAGVKTFFIYTLGGIKAYHDIYDRPETLPLTKFEELYKLIIEFTEGLQR